MAVHPPFSQLVKDGLRFSLGAALLTGLFAHRGDLLDNFAYPIFGYVSVVIEPSRGGAINAGLGRLGGSALGGLIAAVLISAYGLDGSSYYVIPALTFILASLICETYRWEAAYSQATLIGTFIAMRAVGTSAKENIWLYVQARLVDNWIGIMIGFVVVLLFWPQASRSELVKRTGQFLQQVPLMFSAIVDRLSPHSNCPALDSALLLTQLTQLTKTSQKTLASADHEFQGDAMIEENWGAILATQSQIVRQFANLDELMANAQSSLPSQLVDQLAQFKEHLTLACDDLRVDVANPNPDVAQPESIAALHQDVAQIEAKLEQLRAAGKLDQYSVTEVLQCFQLLELCRQIIRSLQALYVNLHERANEIANHQRRPILTLPTRKPISRQRVIEIIGMGMAIGMILAVISHISFPFPSALYSKVASLVVVGGVVFLVQPLRGKAIAVGLAGVVLINLILFWIYLVATAFGFNPVSGGLVYFLLYISCAALGATPLARIGAIIAGDVFAKSIAPVFEQALHAASFSVFAAAIIAILISFVFMGGSAASQFTQSLSQTYRQLGQLYQSLLTPYLQDWATDQQPNPEVHQIKQTIGSMVAKHPLLGKVAGIELGLSATAAQQKSQWKVWLNHEQQLLTQLSNLEEYVQTPPPDWIKQRFSPELQTIVQQTADRFNHVAGQITGPLRQPSFQAPLAQQIEALEQQLLSLRSESRNYPLTALIPFSATFITLKAIADNLDQITQDSSGSSA